MFEINSPSLSNSYNSGDFEKKIAEVKNENKKDNEKLFNGMVGVVIFIAVAFLIEIFTMNNDRIVDKEMYIQYTQMYKDYFEESSKIKENVNEEMIKLNNLENEFELLKAKNRYLK